MFVLLLLSFFFPTVSEASLAELLLATTSQNHLLLKSSDCQELIKEHQSICRWKKNIEPDFIIPEIKASECKNIGGALKSMTVSNCLPKFVKENQNKKLFQSGANCWGTAMSFKKISSVPRFVWQKEMLYWMESPVCRKLNPDEKKEPGDILNIYGPEYIFQRGPTKGDQFWKTLFRQRLTEPRVQSGYSGFHQLLHSETYVSDELSFGKESPSKDDRFKFNKVKEIYGRSRDSDCQENQNLEPYFREYQKPPRNIKGSRCDYFSLAFRCENFEDYFAKEDLTYSEKKIWEEIESLTTIQKRLFSLMTISQKKISPVEVKKMVSFADEMSGESLKELEFQSLSKNTEMLLTLKYFTAQGIRKSLEQAKLIPATEPL